MVPVQHYLDKVIVQTADSFLKKFREEKIHIRYQKYFNKGTINMTSMYFPHFSNPPVPHVPGRHMFSIKLQWKINWEIYSIHKPANCFLAQGCQNLRWMGNSKTWRKQLLREVLLKRYWETSYKITAMTTIAMESFVLKLQVDSNWDPGITNASRVN